MNIGERGHKPSDLDTFTSCTITSLLLFGLKITPYREKPFEVIRPELVKEQYFLKKYEHNGTEL